MDDAVGAAEVRRELVGGHVRARPLDLRQLDLRHAASQAEHRLDLRLVRERVEHAGADVAGRADHDDAHQADTPSSSTSVKKAFA